MVMKETDRSEERNIMKRERCSHYLARGALLWGPLYTTGVSSMVYAAAPAISGESASYAEVLLHSALICPSLGAAGGYLRWFLARNRPETAEPRAAASGSGRLLRFRSGRRALPRKAA